MAMRTQMTINGLVRPVFHVAVATILVACAADSTVTVTEPPPPPPPPPPPMAAPAIAVVGVNVRTMNQGALLTDQTVLVRDGLIVAIGPAAATSVSPDMLVVEGGGRFLAPGLVDFHTHVNFGTLIDGDSNLLLYLMNGVTTILNMGDYNDGDILALRRRVQSGTIPGPSILAAHFAKGQADGGPASVSAATPEDARRIVRQAKAAGYDFIKVYSRVDPGPFAALMDEARISEIGVVGHGVRTIGMAAMLRAGVDLVAHAEEFLYTHFTSLDVASIPPAAQMMLDEKASVVATVATYETIAAMLFANLTGLDGSAAFLARPGAGMLDPARRAAWLGNYRNAYSARADLSPQLTFQLAMLKAFDEAGVPIMLGTDSPGIPGMTPGFSLHDEIRLLRGAGLSPEAILTAATSAPGAFVASHLPGAQHFGTVAAGQRADLLLLEKDPIEDLTTLKRPLGVMAQGRWYDRGTLTRWADSLTAANQ